MNIISGENIQLNCELMVGSKRDFESNPKIKKEDDSIKIVYDDLNQKYDNPSYCTIFCYTHLIGKPDFIRKMNHMKNPFYLYLHNSDQNFNSKHLSILKEVENVKHIYTQNMNVIDDNVSSLPIGIANEMWPHGNIKEITKYIEIVNRGNFKKTKEVYFNFNVGTNKAKRTKCKDEVSKKGIEWVQTTRYENYLKNLSNYKFAICPEGNGLDTHRFWECLYLKVIPICLRNNLTQQYVDYFPMILLDEWSELRVEMLNYTNYTWNNNNKLELQSYFKEDIYSTDENLYCDPQYESVFDIVIPVGPNDVDKVKEQIEYTRRNVVGYRNIYAVCFDPKAKFKDTISIDEKIFPFTINTIVEIHGKSWRNAWYLQQLLKLYAGFVIPGILDTYLIIDSDTFFMRPVTFVEDNKCCYNYDSNTRNKWGEYFNHMKRLHPLLEEQDKQKSGISHHMIFETSKLKQLFEMIEQHHNNGKKFYEIFLDCVQKKYREKGSGASEYEIYFNYLLKYHKEDIIIRALKWKDLNHYNKNYDYVSIHWHKQTNGCMKKRQEMIDKATEMRNAVNT